jgi:hypothetical protein
MNLVVGRMARVTVAALVHPYPAFGQRVPAWLAGLLAAAWVGACAAVAAEPADQAEQTQAPAPASDAAPQISHLGNPSTGLTKSGNAFPAAPTNGNLWAAVSVPEPLVTTGQVDRLQIQFAMVNDGKEPIDPKVRSWRLNINGKDHPDSEFTFGNGPRDNRWKSLPAGDRLQFGYALGNWFKTPGVYRIIWRGEGFESAPVVFRVMSDLGSRHSCPPFQTLRSP